MIIGLLALALCNLLCFAAPSFGPLFGLRILAGAITAFAGSIASIAVISLVPFERRGRAFAVVVGGLTIALILGVPIGSVVGGIFGWRATFGYSGLVCCLSVLLIGFGVPRIEPQSAQRAAIAPVFQDRAIVRIFLLTTVGFAAAFTIIAYLGPIINRLTGLTGAFVGPLQAFIGVGSFVGLATGGVAADRKMIRTGLLSAFGLMAIVAAAYSLALSFPASPSMQPASAVLILLMSSAMFATVPLNLARLSQLAGPATPVALAINASLVSLGQGLGAIWGSIIGDAAGLIWLGAGGAILATVGALLATRISAHV
jgi:predicted MFS family arabinose efflux permease